MSFRSFACPICLAVGIACLWTVPLAIAGEPIRIDAGTPSGQIRALHGVNNGPLNEGETVDVSTAWKALGIPFARLHDSEWPAGDLVDLHAVFPDPTADPQSPASYRFHRTDDYIAAIRATGSGIVYRLGESIEHSRRKFHVHPPRDYERWSQACLGIIRHYNDGWADGHQHQIRYWEIWNEPENRPVMWSGTDDDYYRLYTTAAKIIKTRYPDLKVGGPSVGATGEVIDGKYRPTPFLQGFLNACRQAEAPLDFFSWHTYSNDPDVYARKADGIRRWLNDQGFPKAEIHLNEWNLLPGNDWTPMLQGAAPEARDRWYAEMGGLPGATFVASVLIGLQDSPVDVANYYSGDTSPFGLFGRFGTPKKTYYSFLAFRQLLETPHRVRVTQTPADSHALAGMNPAGTELRILISRSSVTAADDRSNLTIDQVPWTGPTVFQVLHLDSTHNMEPVETTELTISGAAFTSRIPAAGVVLVKLRKKI